MKFFALCLELAAASFALTACTTTVVSPPATPTAASTATSPATPTATSPPPVAQVAQVSSRKETAKADPAKVVPYPFTTCAVIRKDLEGSPKYRRVYKNQEVIFCCVPCVKAFDANPEPHMPRIIEAAAAKARGEAVNSGW